MFSRLQIDKFKSLCNIDVRLPNPALLIGPNGGGKSNFLDVIRVLQGIGNGFSVAEVLDGRNEDATHLRWDGVRGGAAEALYTLPSNAGAPGGQDDGAERFFGIAVEISGDAEPSEYSIGIEPHSRVVIGENLNSLNRGFGTEKVYPGSSVIEVAVRLGRRGAPPHFTFSNVTPVLTQLSRADGKLRPLAPVCQKVMKTLSDVQFLDIDVRQLRQYCHPGHRRLGDHGENFAAVAVRLAEEGVLQPWLEELLPGQAVAVKPFTTQLGEIMFGTEESGGVHVSAHSLSDGTLRFAALATALLAADRPGLLLLEEIENGLHPARMQLIVEMLLATADRGQVIATTHSPALLAMWPKDRHDDVLVVTRGETGTRIVPLTHMPGYEAAISDNSIESLQIEGWTVAPV